jgi:hypothetical protein
VMRGLPSAIRSPNAMVAGAVVLRAVSDFTPLPPDQS